VLGDEVLDQLRRHRDGEVFRARDRDIDLPAHLRGVVREAPAQPVTYGFDGIGLSLAHLHSLSTFFGPSRTPLGGGGGDVSVS
jgi:hypothetical protein